MQETVERFINKYQLNNKAEFRYIDLVSEIGELGKEILKGSDYETREYTNTADVESEIGDCLFSLLALCCGLDIEASKALESALNKYATRFDEKGKIDSGM